MADMKAALIEILAEQMGKNEKIVAVDADINCNATYDMKARYPERHFNVGIAEADAIGTCAGLSAYGFIPVTGSFATFASRRVCDQIALSCCYAKQNVKIIGSDPGVMAEYNGGTHMAIDDIGALRSIPTLRIIEPIDVRQLRQAIPAVLNEYGTTYIRFNRKDAPDVFDDDYIFDLNRADLIREGGDVSIIAAGIEVAEAMKAAQALAKKGIEADVLAVHTIKPLDRESVLATAKKTGRVLTCENHNLIGGLYSAVSETLCGKAALKMDAIGICDHFGEVGQKDELMKKFHLTADDITAAAEKLLQD